MGVVRLMCGGGQGLIIGEKGTGSGVGIGVSWRHLVVVGDR